MSASIEHVTLGEAESSLRTGPLSGSGQHQPQHTHGWAHFVLHYTAAIATVLELATLLVIVAFHRTDLVIGAAIFGLLVVVVLMGFKAKLDPSEEAQPHISRAH